MNLGTQVMNLLKLLEESVLFKVNCMKQEILELVKSPRYIKVANEVLSRSYGSLSEKLHEVVINIYDRYLEFSGISLDEVNLLLETPQFINFSIVYNLAKKSLEVGQEYNPVEKGLNEEDEETEEKYLGHAQPFLIGYAIYFLLLTKYPERLSNYLKLIRQPHAARYKKLLQKWYADNF